MGFNTRLVAVSIVVAGLFVFGAGQAWADAITYDIADYADDQDGWTLSGTITTDGTIGTLEASDITAWDFSITDGIDTYSLSSSSLATLDIGGAVSATANAITIAATDSGSVFSIGDYDDTPLLFYYRSSGTSGFDQYFSADADTNTLWLAYPTASMGGTDPWVIATNPVPEPGTLALFGLGLAGAALCRRRRNARVS